MCSFSLLYSLCSLQNFQNAPGSGECQTIFDQDFNTDSDASFDPGDGGGNDSDTADVVEKKKLRRRRRSLSDKKPAQNIPNGGFSIGAMMRELANQVFSATKIFGLDLGFDFSVKV